jgi:PucR C-terminal helix-turn-helix domain/GGDEF-like domain
VLRQGAEGQARGGLGGPPRSLARARSELRARLESRRAEIEQAILTRVYSISDPRGVSDPDYVNGLRTAVSTAIDHGLASIESTSDRPPSVPPVLLVQARVAARNGIGLDAILRRYFAGYALLGNFLIEETEQGGLLEAAEMKRLLRTQATLFDRLIAAVTEEYSRESEGGVVGSEQQRVERVLRLLRGELIDTSELDYPLDAHHIGLVAVGPDVAEVLRDLTIALDRRLLLVQPDDRTIWAWLGSRRKPGSEDIENIVAASLSPELVLAVGQPAEGLVGWRLTHQQAVAALPVALRGSEKLVRYADVALLASILQDDLLAASLRQLYLAPLECERDGGKVSRETLAAYFRAGRSVSSAAAILGVSRQAVSKRLRAVEGRLGRSLDLCAMELEATLRLNAMQPDKGS